MAESFEVRDLIWPQQMLKAKDQFYGAFKLIWSEEEAQWNNKLYTYIQYIQYILKVPFMASETSHTWNHWCEGSDKLDNIFKILKN